MPRKQQRRAWGSVTEIKRGKKYVLRWMENTPEGRKRKTRTIYGTYREACAALDMIHAEKHESHAAPTIGEVYKRWYLPRMDKNLLDGTIKYNTHIGRVKMWRRHIEPRWSTVPVDSVAPLEVQQWLDTLSLAVAEQCMVILKQIVDIAVMYELVQTNKFRTKYCMPQKSAGYGKGIYDNKKSEEVLHLLRGQLLEAPYIIMRFGGTRTGEALGIRVDEIQFVENDGLEFAVIPIIRRMDKAHEPVEDLKTKESKRTTVIPPPYSNRLKEIAVDLERDGIEWIANSGNGAPMDIGRANYLWRSACEKATGYKLIPMRNLRTSWRTSAELEWGIDPRILEILMGHKLGGTTGRHYMRPNGQMETEAFMREYANNVST